MSKNRLELGEWGENHARVHLEQQGYAFVAANWRIRVGEIDLIMKEKETLVFVEVRTKSSIEYGYGYETISYKKQQKLIQLANAYIQYTQVEYKTIRFDAISIDKEGEGFQLKHIPNIIHF